MKRKMIIICSIFAMVAVTGLMIGASPFGAAVDIQPQNNELPRSESFGIVKLASVSEKDSGSDVQLVEAKVEPFAYPQITVEVSRPVRINFKVDAAYLNACNNEIIITEWNIKKPLTVGDNFVEFTPTQTGTFGYSCWMDMIRSEITVTGDSLPVSQAVVSEDADTSIVIPDQTAVSVDGDVTVIEAKIAPGGYPELIVEVNKPVRINFKADAADLNSCNNEIVIPEWNIRKKLSAGYNFVEFTPTKMGTFGYSCWMNMIQSSITIVEQGSNEIGALPLPESANSPSGCGMMSWFVGSGGGCCGR